MTIRFWRRVRLAPGVTLNFSRRGASVSLGRRGAHFTVGSSGTRETIGLPGSGLFWTVQQPRSHDPATEASLPPGEPGSQEAAALRPAHYAAGAVVLVLLLAALVGCRPRRPGEAQPPAAQPTSAAISSTSTTAPAA